VKNLKETTLKFSLISSRPWEVVNSFFVFQLKLVDQQSKEAEFARKALFSKHPEMKGNWLMIHELEAFILSVFT